MHVCHTWTRYHRAACRWVLSWRKAAGWDAGIAWTASTPPRLSHDLIRLSSGSR